MKTVSKIIFLSFISILLACSGSNKKKDPYESKESSKEQTQEKQSSDESAADDEVNKGIGPFTSVDIPSTIDESKVKRGKKVFNNLCTACHKMEKKVVGPAISGVTERRSPEWVMNMIVNPQEMIKKDPIAKKLLVEHNMAVMANQNVSEEDARAIYEYFRKYDEK